MGRSGYRITVWMDEYCEQTNTVYEFVGCQFHGYCKYDNPKKILETYIRKGALENLGYISGNDL